MMTPRSRSFPLLFALLAAVAIARVSTGSNDTSDTTWDGCQTQGCTVRWARSGFGSTVYSKVWGVHATTAANGGT